MYSMLTLGHQLPPISCNHHLLCTSLFHLLLLSPSVTVTQNSFLFYLVHAFRHLMFCLVILLIKAFCTFTNQFVVNSWWSMSSPQTFSPHNKCLLQITCHYKAPGVECERDIHLTESIDRFALVLVSVVPYLPPPQQG